MSDDFQVGDVVVCVHASSPACSYSTPPEKGRHYRVTGVIRARCAKTKRPVQGVEVAELSATPFSAFHELFFRKLPKADETFTEQMRSLRPHKVEQPA